MKHRLGWIPDLPDVRDFRSGSVDLAATIACKGQAFAKAKSKVDLRPHFSPVEDQGDLGSCTAQAAVGLLEYYERRAAKRHVEASRRFLYLATRRLSGFQGDSGAYLRSTMGALALFGAAPERLWPYNVAQFDVEPPPMVWSAAQAYRAIRYYRVDGQGMSGPEKLGAIKKSLASGLPLMFGFTVYSSIWSAETSGDIPFPSSSDSVEGGHGVVTCGYDDPRAVLLIRNSWGVGWGDEGYGTLPYAYVTEGLADDFWSLTRADWTDLGAFEE